MTFAVCQHDEIAHPYRNEMARLLLHVQMQQRPRLFVFEKSRIK